MIPCNLTRFPGETWPQAGDRVAALDGKSFAFRVWYWFNRGRGLSEREAARAAIEATGCTKLANQMDAEEAAA